jgi:hypothetical protein
MEINIIIKGGEELEKFYPKGYESFLNNLTEMVLEAFPGVDGCLLDTEPTDRHKAEKDRREAMRKEELKMDFASLIEDPAFLEKIRALIAKSEDSCPK